MPKYTFQNTIDALKSQSDADETAEQLQERIYDKLFETRPLPPIPNSDNNLVEDYQLSEHLAARRRLHTTLAEKLSQTESVEVKRKVPDVLQGLQKAYHYYTNHINKSRDDYELRRAFNNDNIFQKLDNAELHDKSDAEKEKLQHEKALSRGRLIAGICGDYRDVSASDMLNWNDTEIVEHFDEINHVYQLSSILQQTLDNQNSDVQFDEKTRKRCQHMYEMFNAASCVYQRFEQIMSPYYPYLDIYNLAKNNSVPKVREFCTKTLIDNGQDSALTELSTVLQNSAETERRRTVALLQAQAAKELGVDTLESVTFSHSDGREFDITDPTDELIEYIHSGKPIIVGGTNTQKQLRYNPDSRKVDATTTSYGHVREQLFASDGGLDALVKQMQDADPVYLHNRLYNNGSPQFSDMKKALLRFSETVKQLENDTSSLSSKKLEQLKQQAEELSKMAAAYLDYKGNPTTNLATRRVSAAAALHNFLTGANGTPGLNNYLNQMFEEKLAELSRVQQEPVEKQRPDAKQVHFHDWVATFELKGKVNMDKLNSQDYLRFSTSIKKLNDMGPFSIKDQQSDCINALNARMNNILSRSADIYTLFNSSEPDKPNELPKPLVGESLSLAQEVMRSTVLKHLLTKEASSLDNKSNLIYRSIKNADINEALSLVSEQLPFQYAMEDMTPKDMYDFVTTMNDPDGPMQQLAKDVGKAIYKEAYLAKSTLKKQQESQPTLKSTLKKNSLEHRKIERSKPAKRTMRTRTKPAARLPH